MMKEPTLPPDQKPDDSPLSAEAAFEARAEAAWQNYQRSGISHSVDDVFDRIEARIIARRKERFGA